LQRHPETYSLAPNAPNDEGDVPDLKDSSEPKPCVTLHFRLPALRWGLLSCSWHHFPCRKMPSQLDWVAKELDDWIERNCKKKKSKTNDYQFQLKVGFYIFLTTYQKSSDPYWHGARNCVSWHLYLPDFDGGKYI